MTDYTEDGYWSYSNIQAPLRAYTGETTLKDLDPVLDAMIDFYKKVIYQAAGARWDTECADVRPDLVGHIVWQTLPYDALPLAKENQFRFPLLMVYPVEETFEDTTFTYDHIRGKFDVVYVMPPLEVEAAERLLPFLRFIVKALVSRTREGFDSNIDLGKTFWTDCRLEEISFISSSYGKAALTADANMFFPTVQMRVEVVERSMLVEDNYPFLEGIDLVIEDSLGDTEAITVEEIAINTEIP